MFLLGRKGEVCFRRGFRRRWVDWSPHPQVSRAEVWTVDLHNLFSVSFVMQGFRKALENVGQGIGLSLHVRKVGTCRLLCNTASKNALTGLKLDQQCFWQPPSAS